MASDRPSGFGPTAYPMPAYPILPNGSEAVDMLDWQDEHEQDTTPDPCACKGGQGCDGSFCRCVELPPDPWADPFSDGSE